MENNFAGGGRQRESGEGWDRVEGSIELRKLWQIIANGDNRVGGF